jgi:hypothetical protein
VVWPERGSASWQTAPARLHQADRQQSLQNGLSRPAAQSGPTIKTLTSSRRALREDVQDFDNAFKTLLSTPCEPAGLMDSHHSVQPFPMGNATKPSHLY